jgi:hypothetical protein
LTGTDRSNLVQIRDRDENYPYPYEKTTFWSNVNVRWSPMGKSNNNIRKDDLALYFASAGYYRFVLGFLFFSSNLIILVVNVLPIVQKQLIVHIHSTLKQRN